MADEQSPEKNKQSAEALSNFLLYGFIPMWTAAGVFDWYCHKKTDIEHTSGIKEALLHILMNAEAGAPLMLALLFEINTGVFSAMLAGLLLHEATVWWDISYAERHRETPPFEQHVHSFLEVLPFMGLAMAACLNPEKIAKRDFSLRLKSRFEPAPYWAAIAAMVVGGVVLPYGNEVWRCFRARKEPKRNTGFYEE
ncbi:MAG: diguanylate cyclase/phosphodiesterase [Candidatus Eremiobacteraeota bacterium]|nr:diguanylate cyclase/phosphodiesterase [Candidatus Eremiobacteraeota bacterium]